MREGTEFLHSVRLWAQSVNLSISPLTKCFLMPRNLLIWWQNIFFRDARIFFLGWSIFKPASFDEKGLFFLAVRKKFLLQGIQYFFSILIKVFLASEIISLGVRLTWQKKKKKQRQVNLWNWEGREKHYGDGYPCPGCPICPGRHPEASRVPVLSPHFSLSLTRFLEEIAATSTVASRRGWSAPTTPWHRPTSPWAAAARLPTGQNLGNLV